MVNERALDCFYDAVEPKFRTFLTDDAAL